MTAKLKINLDIDESIKFSSENLSRKTPKFSDK